MLKKTIGLSFAVLAMSSFLLIGCGLEKTVKPAQPTAQPGAQPAAQTDAKPAAQPAATDPKANAVPKYKDVKADYTLKLSLQEPATKNAEYISAQIFKDYVEAQTNGKVQVELYPSAQLGKEREVFEAVKAGNIDIGMMADGPVANFVPEVTVLAIPYLFQSGPVAWEVIHGPFGKEMKTLILDKTGNRVLGFGENGFRSFTTNKKPIHKLEDLKDSKIRVMENKMYVAMVNALGAQAIPMAGGEELYSALQQHVVDGQENPLDGIYAHKLYEVQDYITVDNHTFSSKFLVMNDKIFNSMPAEYKNIITEAGVIWENHMHGPKEAASLEAFYLLKDNVKEIYPLPAEEKARFKEAAQPAVMKWMEEQIGREWIDKVQNAVKEAESTLYGK